MYCIHYNYSVRWYSNVGAFSRTAELNLSPVQRRMKTGTKGRKRGRRGEALLPVEEVRREEYSRHLLLDHTTVVHKVGETDMQVFFFLINFWHVDLQVNIFVFSGSQERKLQRRSVRSRSESERGTDPVPKKKTKKEQVSVIPIWPGVKKHTADQVRDA